MIINVPHAGTRRRTFGSLRAARALDFRIPQALKTKRAYKWTKPDDEWIIKEIYSSTQTQRYMVGIQHELVRDYSSDDEITKKVCIESEHHFP